MKKFFLTVIVIAVVMQAYSQNCTVSVSPKLDTIVCGASVSLSAFGKGQGILMLDENFNNGSLGPGWAATTQANWNNPCGAGPNGSSGTHIWMGNAAPVPRVLTTAGFNLSTATAGVSVCFDMKFAAQTNGTSPCEGPDEPQEGVYLQYSIDNGATWVTIHYFDPNGGDDPQLTNWNNWCFPIPQAALTTNTRFRWFQDADSGADYDHWGLDNIQAFFNDPSYSITWPHDGYNAGATGGVNPTPVAPRTTTIYPVVMTNGNVTCRDTVTLVVINPVVQPNAGSDTTICEGSCVQLNGNARVIHRAGGVRTYRNTQPEPIASSFGSSTTVNVNVQTLNMEDVQPNSILSVCISKLTYSGIGAGGIEDVGDLNLFLQCPDGTRITLVPAGVVTPDYDTTILFPGFPPLVTADSIGFLNTCFVPVGPNITVDNGTRHTGSYATNQSFNGLAGCTANGVWSLVVQSAGGLSGSGTLTGWSITFDDPEESYLGNFFWSPTTNMTGANTETPTVCPTSTPNTYTLTLSDTAGCVTATDAVTISTQVCCNISASAVLTQPSCGAGNGAINLTVLPTGAYTFAWSDGPITTEDRTNLAAGTYSVTITDPVNGCIPFDTTFTLNSSSNMAVTFPAMTNPTCAGNDGSLTVTLSGGNAPYTVTIDTGGTPVTMQLPFAGTQPLTGLHAGTVSISVTDAQGCQASNDTTLVTPTNCCTFTISLSTVQPTCGASNGSVTVAVQNGSGNYTYAWSSGGSTTANATGLSAGPVSVTVTDVGQACSKDTTVQLNSSSNLSVTFPAMTNPTCAGNDGSLTVTLSGGTAPYTVTIDTGGTPVIIQLPFAGTQPVPGLHAGTVSISVTDAQGCQASNDTILIAPTNCCTFTVSAALVTPACGQADGSVSLTAANGSGNYTYNWAGGLGSSSTISSVAAGNYDVTITDTGFPNCFIDTTFSLTNLNAPVIDNIAVTNETCPGSGDGFAIVTASGGTGSLTYAWANSQTSDTAINLIAGSYAFTVTDANNCQAAGVAVVQSGFCCTLQATAAVIPPACGQNTGTITVTIATAGAAPYQYSIDGSNYQSSNVFSGVPSGSYNVITRDSMQCTDTVAAVIPAGGANLTITVTSTNVTCFGANNGTALATPDNGIAPFNYLWNTTAATASLSSLQPGQYTVTVSDADGCTGSGTTTVTQPAALVIDIGNDIIVCQGTPVTLQAGSGYSSYQWSSGEATGSITPLISGFYEVTVQDTAGCTASDGVNVNIVDIPTVDLGEDLTLYEDMRVTLNPNITGSTGGNYNWQPQTFLSCSNCSLVVATAEEDITYTVTYTDPNGCASSDQINITVIPVVQLFWPNAFSPNGDGNNDVFIPYGSGVKLINWKVFNRWGEKIFDTNNFFQGWDGKYKSVLQNPGVYIYEANVTLMNDETKKYRGSFTLIH